jgi:uridine kinase
MAGIAETLAEIAQRLLEARPPRIVVALDGRIGAGKSTMASAIADRTSACVIPGDDFYAFRITDAEWEARSTVERVRDVIDWRHLRTSALEPLRAGRAASWQTYGAMQPDGSFHVKPEPVCREPAPLIVLEGAYTTQPALADLIDLTVLIDTPTPLRLERTGKRDAPDFLEHWHRRWDEAESYYFTRVRPPSSFDLVADTVAGEVKGNR